MKKTNDPAENRELQLRELARFMRHEDTSVMFDSVSLKKALQSLECKRNFFYTHGETSEKIAGRLEKRLAEKFGKDHPYLVTAVGDVWKQWPKDSYFHVRVTLKPSAK